MSKCEHGLTSKECYVCASPKYGAPRCPDCGGSGFVYVGSGRLPPAKCRCAARAAPAAPPPSERAIEATAEVLRTLDEAIYPREELDLDAVRVIATTLRELGGVKGAKG